MTVHGSVHHSLAMALSEHLLGLLPRNAAEMPILYRRVDLTAGTDDHLSHNRPTTVLKHLAAATGAQGDIARGINYFLRLGKGEKVAAVLLSGIAIGQPPH